MSKVGKILKLQHVQSFKRGGQAVLRKIKPQYVKIVMEYSDGSVVPVGSLDVWEVRGSKDPKAQFETYIPEALLQ